MSLQRILLTALLCLAPGLALASDVTVVQDRAAFLNQLHINRHLARGGIDAATVANVKQKSFPHFSASFTVRGVTYPYTMVGYAPTSGQTATVGSVIVPLRLRFVGFGTNDIVFEPGRAVDNIVR
jgi:hypothetical protein